MLRDFVNANRNEILAQARLRVIARSGTHAGTDAALGAGADEDRTKGLPIFLDQLGEALRKARADETLDHTEIQASAHQHGHALFHHGLSVDQVVHDYGDLCQVITNLAVEQKASVDVAEFGTLNLCLDDAIAGAVMAYSKEHDRVVTVRGAEHLGVLAHEMRNVLNSAILAFGSIKEGVVAISGSTSAILDRSHLRLQALIDRSLADVRLDVGLHDVALIPVLEILRDVAIGGALVAQPRGIRLAVTNADATVFVEGDRQILTAAVANLLQNALKFTRPATTVTLRAIATETRVRIEVEDECGGLPPGKAEDLFRPFEQRGTDRSGLGLGLAICLKAAKASAGELHVRDLPRHGCVFALNLPRKSPPPPN